MTISAAELLDPRAGVVPAGARSVRNLHNSGTVRSRKVTPLNMGGPDIDEQSNNQGANDVPKGIYKRQPKADGEGGAKGADTTDKPKTRNAKVRKVVKAARRAPAARSSPRFGKFDDGSVQITTPECKGRLAAAEVDALVSFLGAGKLK